MTLISYEPPGAQATAFHSDDSFFRGLMGPVGSGKSSSCCVEIVYRAIRQEKHTDGVRRSRWAAIRNTYAELKSTTIKTWNDWFGAISEMKWDTPILSTMRFGLPDGTTVELEVMFVAIDRPDEVGKLRSIEFTGVWLNEASELPKEVLDMATQRVGRYPSMRLGGPSWTGVIGDTNPPDDDHWWYRLAEDERPDGYKFFTQPGALYRVIDPKSADFGKYKPNPNAENIKNIRGGYQYYFQQLPGKTEDYIRVFIEGKYGTTMDGKPVYPEFDEKVHVATRPLSPTPGVPIVLGFDFGLTPACIVGQMRPNGKVAILREFVSEDMGIRQFYSEVVLPALNAEFRMYRWVAVGDPAGNNRSQTDERTCFEELEDLGLYCEGAYTNEFVKRRESVAFFLQRVNGFEIDPGCKTLIKGFRGGYRFERIKASGPTRHKDRPVKDKFSHPHDGLQYLCMELRGSMTAPPPTDVVVVAWA